ncbi:MAG: PrsW family glutamic-type intramembrane protease [Anaerolineae bacterium]|jgi:RsiW-degrading membrane proteinase PrsW (M82 family)
MTLLALLIATGIPALFLIVIYTLDLYASRTFRLVLICFGWGSVGGFGLALLTNSFVAPRLARALTLDPQFLLVVAVAPVVEEIVKSLCLFYVSGRPEFTYFVDGAIYGFASGIGFSITENFLYISQNPSVGVPLALTRSFSTCLMHGTAAGLVGAAVGRFRFKRQSGRQLALIGGWVTAILIHALFNLVAWRTSATGSLGALVGMGIGLAGVGLIVLFIFLGLREERAWLADTLNREVGVTDAEVRAAQSYGSLEEILKPITKQFPKEAKQVQALVLKQAQMGIKRKVQQRVKNPKLQERLGRDITQLQEEMEELRKDVGLGVMTYVRCVFPEGAADMWACMEELEAHTGPPDVQRWAEMLTADEGQPSERSIFLSLKE